MSHGAIFSIISHKTLTVSRAIQEVSGRILYHKPEKPQTQRALPERRWRNSFLENGGAAPHEAVWVMASRRCRSGRRTARRRRRPHRGPNLRCTPATPTSHGRPPWTSRCSNFNPHASVTTLAHCCSLIDRCLVWPLFPNISRREQQWPSSHQTAPR